MPRLPEEREARRVRRMAVDRWALMGVRGSITRARINEAKVNLTQLVVRNSLTLRVLAAGTPTGATSDDVGKFVFVPGYSDPSGDDFVPS